MEVVFSHHAEADFLSLEKQLQKHIKKHLEKLSKMPPRRHMKHGLPWFVEKITKQARLVYRLENECLHVLRCFATHKEYERWYLSFK
ncbi:hypothetical protein DRN67_03580 [Candidatus Micrarchaeota archaeon]|nr:MAG: hypothetical protein DRN67_03580 [Candidatus Micrarchaeota archaeon]